MSITFEVDCGEVVAGHRLVARGLHDEADARRLGRRRRMQSLSYALVPGLGQAELRGADSVDFRVWFEGAAHRRPWRRRRTSGGFLDVRPDQPETRGGFGPFPVPVGASRVGVDVVGIHVRPVGADESLVREGPDLGSLVVDVSSGAARWEPARETWRARLGRFVRPRPR